MVELNIKLPESFFQEEERDGYLVSAKTKELWAVQLDLLNEFDRVCKKHNLKYILDWGTLLGAIRHNGFIPWDDDVDVSMLREDYDKLMEIGPKEFKHPYFLQNHYTDKNYSDCVTKLRRSDTTSILSVDVSFRYKLAYNKGIFIDIFVFDNLPSVDNATVEATTRIKNDFANRWRVVTRTPLFELSLRYPARLLRYVYFRCKYGDNKKAYWDHEQWAKHYPDSSVFIANTMVPGKLTLRPRIWNDKVVIHQFENLMLPVSSMYDDVLHALYGDYMVPVHGSSAHSLLYCDTDKAYTEVESNKELMAKLWKEVLKNNQ